MRIQLLIISNCFVLSFVESLAANRPIFSGLSSQQKENWVWLSFVSLCRFGALWQRQRPSAGGGIFTAAFTLSQQSFIVNNRLVFSVGALINYWVIDKDSFYVWLNFEVNLMIFSIYFFILKVANVAIDLILLRSLTTICSKIYLPKYLIN